MNRFDRFKEKLSKESLTKTGFWQDTMPQISHGAVVPIISNSFRIEQIFRENKEVADPAPNLEDQDLTYDEQLTKVWADFIEYPMADKHNLARVAQYFLVEQKDSLQARGKYLEFLKEFFLEVVGSEEESQDLVGKLKAQVKELQFSEIVREMEYPRFRPGDEDALCLLARLPLPIYVTTSYYDFLECALEGEGKKPRTQVCFWSGELPSAKIDRWPEPDFEASATQPIVYHLFGIESYSQTLVLSEDDFMEFLVVMAKDTDTQKPIIPLKLREVLANSPLLLLGYQLRDWDFRILFRFISNYRNRDKLTPRGMYIQLKPDGKNIGDKERSLKYLSNYFDRRKFDVEWTSTEDFIKKLWAEWNKYRQGQA
ncbi:MAG: SIR2 family protein [Chloroflexota bacterium]